MVVVDGQERSTTSAAFLWIRWVCAERTHRPFNTEALAQARVPIWNELVRRSAIGHIWFRRTHNHWEMFVEIVVTR